MPEKPWSVTGEQAFDIVSLCRYFSELSPQPMVAVEGATHIVRHLNAAFARLVGKEREELIGRPFAEAVPEGDENGCLLLLDRVYRTGTPEILNEQEHCHTTPAVYWSYSVWAILGADERPVGVIIQVTDATEMAIFRSEAVTMNEQLLLSATRQHELTETAERANRLKDESLATLSHEIAERKAAEESIRFQAHLLDTVEQSVIATNLDGIVIYWNRFAHTLYGWTAEEALGRHIMELTTPEEMTEPALEIMSQLSQGKSWTGEFKVQRRDGTTFPVQIINSPITDDKGTLVGIVGVSTDITERKRQEASLRELTSQLERQTRVFNTTLSSITDFAYIFDREGRFVYANQAQLDLWGLSLDEAVGKNFFDLRYPDDLASRLQQQIEQVFETRQGLRDETAYTSPTGVSGYYEYIFSPVVTAEGAVEVVAGSTRDISERKRVEIALRDSGERLQMAMYAAKIYSWEMNIATEQIEWSNNLERVIGFHLPSDFADANSFIHPEDREETAKLISQAISSGKDYESEFRLVNPKNGEIVWVRGQAVLVGDAQDSRHRFVGITRNITERKQAEAHLRESEERFRAMFEQANVGIVQASFDGILLKVNPGFSKIVGYSQEEASGMAIRDLTHPDDYKKEEALTSQLVAGQIPGYSIEKRYLCKDGYLVWGEMTATLVRQSSGEPFYVLAIVEDISERKWAEEALRESKERLSAMFEASRDGILVEDDERIVYVNTSYTHLFGYDAPEELIGQHVSTVISPQDAERMLEYGRRRAQGESIASVYEFKGKRKDGTLVDVEASVSTSTVAGRAYITTMIRDITERKQAQEALWQAHDQLEQRVAERTAELAHTNKALQSEIYARTRIEEARRHLLWQLVTAQEDERRRISRELHDQMGQHIVAIVLLVNSLKEFSQSQPATVSRFAQLEDVAQQLSLQVDTLAWKLRPTELDDLGLHAALRNYVEKWSKRYQLPVDLHSVSLTDQRLGSEIETAIYRIVLEALNNIIKHARATSVSLILERRGNHAFAIIEDDGCGFDVEGLSAVDAGQRRMGLLGMEERTALVGGTLNIESSPGAGTTIFVRIPLAFDEDGEKSF